MIPNVKTPFTLYTVKVQYNFFSIIFRKIRLLCAKFKVANMKLDQIKLNKYLTLSTVAYVLHRTCWYIR